MNFEEFYAARVLMGEERWGPRIAEVEDAEDAAMAKARRFASD